MQKKLSVFKLNSDNRMVFLAIALFFVFLLSLSFFRVSAQEPSPDYNVRDGFSLSYRLSDLGCTGQTSEWFDASVNTKGAWRSDTNNHEIGCVELRLTLEEAESTTDDFKVCIETAETMEDGAVSGIGTERCTGFASQGGGNATVGTANGQRVSAMRIWVETDEVRALDKTIDDFRFGFKIGNVSASEWGETVWTKKIGELDSANPSSISNVSFLDGESVFLTQLYLESEVSEVDLISRLDDNQGQIYPYRPDFGDENTGGVRFIDRSGNIFCPGNGVLQAITFQDQGDNTATFGYCWDTVNFFEASVPLDIVPMLAHGPAADHRDFTCNPGYALVGFEHNGIHGDKGARSLICRKVRDGILDYSDIRRMQGTNGPSGCPGGSCLVVADGTYIGGLAQLFNEYKVNTTEMYVFIGGNYSTDDITMRSLYSVKVKPQYELVAIENEECDDADPDCVPVPPIDGPECNNAGFDDDGDGPADFGNDPECLSPSDDSESVDERDGPAPVVECEDGVDNDKDGYIDGDDPGCGDGGEELDTITCGFTANPTVVALNIGTSQLSWDCKHVINDKPVSSSLGNLTITDDDSAKDFPAISSPLSPIDGSANVTPERRTEFKLTLPNADPSDGLDLLTETVSVDVTTTTFDEEIP